MPIPSSGALNRSEREDLIMALLSQEDA